MDDDEALMECLYRIENIESIIYIYYYTILLT